jgi:serine/threonine protein kinase
VREKYRKPGLPRRLALKVAKEEYEGALKIETDLLRRFDHPNVVRIFPIPRGKHPRPVYAAREQFPFGWGWYYAMELLGGGSLERRLTRSTAVTHLLQPSEGERRLSLLETLGIAHQLLAALEHIHAQHVVNLDVKPDNVLFRRQRFRYLQGSVPQVVLCDFGISRDWRYPRSGLLGVGTLEYLSPEHALEESQHQPVDVRSDIFSLSIVLYEMLTGVLPFDNVGLVVDPAYVPSSPRQRRSSVPKKLDEIVMRALAKDPAFRFQTAAEMRATLEQVPMPPDWGASARRAFAGVTLAACLAAGGLAISRCGGPPPPLLTRTPTPVAETATSPPAVTPTTSVPTVSPTATQQPAKPTVTKAPTLTPTNTPPPPTHTPTPGG